MIFLVVDKVKALCYGVFDNEQDAVKYMGGGDGVKIVYLGDEAVKTIKTLSEADPEMEGFKTYRHATNPKEKELHDRFLNEHILHKHTPVDLLVFSPKNEAQTVAVDELTDREKRIMLSTIQWLGSPCGQGFLLDCGFQPLL